MKTLQTEGMQIAQAKRSGSPRYGMTVDGYTKRSGAPTSIMVRLAGENRWRRLMVWQNSNCGTCFLRIKGEPVIVEDCNVPAV